MGWTGSGVTTWKRSGARPCMPASMARVGAQLQDGPALRLARELGVVRLVRPAAQAARLLDAHQDVGVAGHVFVGQARLDNHVRAVAHGGQRGRGLSRERLGGRRTILAGDGHDVQPLRAQGLHVALLVLFSLSPEDGRVGILVLRLSEHVSRRRQVEPGLVAAADEGGEIGRCQEQRVGDEAHRGKA